MEVLEVFAGSEFRNDSAIRGVERGKKQVYPCPVYLPSRALMNVLPPVKSLYLKSQQKKLNRFPGVLPLEEAVQLLLLAL